MKYIHDLNTIQMLGHHFYEQVRPVAGRFLMLKIIEIGSQAKRRDHGSSLYVEFKELGSLRFIERCSLELPSA